MPDPKRRVIGNAEWFAGRLTEALSETKGISDKALLSLSDWTGSLPHCEKGLCMTPATRFATYYGSGDDHHHPAMFCLSCDTHGTEPTIPLAHAPLLRAVERELTRLGSPPWWVEYSGGNDIGDPKTGLSDLVAPKGGGDA